MRRAARFVVALLAGLGLVTLGASFLVDRTIRQWFERDVAMRADLAVNSASRAIAMNWHDIAELEHLLLDLTHDERIMAAAACVSEGAARPSERAATPDFPSDVACGRLPAGDGAARRAVHAIEGGSVHVSSHPIRNDGELLGYVLLVHDLSFMERRAGAARNFLLVGLGVLSLAASVVTFVAARVAFRGWTRDLLELLRGDAGRPKRTEMRGILGDVRDLVQRLASERDSDNGARWGPAKLKAVLQEHLRGERVLIVANREPYIHTKKADGTIEVLRPASGLVTALEPVMRACSGVWIAHGSGNADRQTADKHARLRVPPGDEAYWLRRVWLTDEEERGYYYGFSNEGLWPLCHIAHVRPTFRREDYRQYEAVNQKFCDAVCEEAQVEDPIVLVQDYHLALAPRMIRERLPRATILTFWHIPWPNAEHFAMCPWRRELLEGLLGSSIIGFHTQFFCNNFMDGVDRFLEARLDRETQGVAQHGRMSLVRPYPISIEWPDLDGVPPVSACRDEVFRELGLPPTALLGVGVDRLDYTKGIVERLQAVERLLEQNPALRGRFTFVQLAAPSRATIDEYARLEQRVREMVARIEERFGTDTYRPVILLHAHHDHDRVFRFYRAANVCYVSSLHDGMNLVAKEFVASRDDEQGVLVLSHFTGAARELTEALIVNPYDIDEAAAALLLAIQMNETEQRDRMRSMRALVSELDVYRWAGRMLVDAARLRRRERLTDRLSEIPHETQDVRAG